MTVQARHIEKLPNLKYSNTECRLRPYPIRLGMFNAHKAKSMKTIKARKFLFLSTHKHKSYVTPRFIVPLQKHVKTDFCFHFLCPSADEIVNIISFSYRP